MSTVRSGQCGLGSRAATVDRHCACQVPSDAAARSSAAAHIARRRSAASRAESMIARILSRWSVTGRVEERRASAGPAPAPGPVSRMAASSSCGVAPPSWAAAVEPADVPMVRSAVVTSSPASARPARTPISHALPVDPPPPRTSARSPAAGTRWVASTCGAPRGVAVVAGRGDAGVRFMGVAFQDVPGECSRGDWFSRPIVRRREHPVRIMRSRGSPPDIGSRSARRYRPPANRRKPVRGRAHRPQPSQLVAADGTSSFCAASHARATSATSRQPASMVSE